MQYEIDMHHNYTLRIPAILFERSVEERNMKKKKRSRLVWDDIEGDWKPRWGRCLSR